MRRIRAIRRPDQIIVNHATCCDCVHNKLQVEVRSRYATSGDRPDSPIKYYAGYSSGTRRSGGAGKRGMRRSWRRYIEFESDKVAHQAVHISTYLDLLQFNLEDKDWKRN